MKNKLKEDGYGRFSKKRQRLLDSDDEEGAGVDSGFVSLGQGNKAFDDWNRAKRDFNDLIKNLTDLNTMVLGLGAPFRHQSYIFGRPQENI